MMMTQVLVSFRQAGTVDVKVDIDLTLLLGSAERYYELATEPTQKQQEGMRRIAPQVADSLQLFVGQKRLPLELRNFSVPQAQKADYLDTSVSKLSTLNFVAALASEDAPLRLVVPVGAAVDYPIAFTVQVPSAHLSMTRWLDEGMHESQPFAWADKVPRGQGGLTAGSVDPDALSWSDQLRLYLRLGFRHIVPEGADHILFVLGLFFLGITWRKLVSQTTVFTIAHATTLFLSTYGVFRLPGRYVEPAIAASIAVVALENVFRPRLGLARLAIVFAFGLVHGLGFASSLSEVPFPKQDFLIALLGFNFGVDFGQLFVSARAFLAVGWFRDRPWFRQRITIPCSLAVAAVGVVWAVQRIVY
jgi:hydrogenase/urease accessory protein HupE